MAHAFAKEAERAFVVPLAVALIARAYRRHLRRKRLTQYISLKLRVKRRFLLPYLQTWTLYVSAFSKWKFTRLRSCLRAWYEYCASLHELHVTIIRWAERVTAKMGDLSLSWRLCKGAGPDTGTAQ